jgi:pimeloyl-ACP methyl ester carboxylesterase
VTGARLLLVPSFTELEWGIRPQLEEWAEVASFDVPGVGSEPFPEDLDLSNLDPHSEDARAALSAWRDASADRGLAEADRQGWDRFLLVTDSHGAATAVRLAARRRHAVKGLAIGHAALSNSTEGPRAPLNRDVYDAMLQLMRQDRESFVKYGLTQITRGSVSEEVAEQMLERFPDMDFVAAVWELLARVGEPVGDQLARLDLPLLLAKHEGCLGRTDEGFEDIVAAYPEAMTVICPETCTSSPAFAEALRAFCASLRA